MRKKKDDVIMVHLMYLRKTVDSMDKRLIEYIKNNTTVITSVQRRVTRLELFRERFKSSAIISGALGGIAGLIIAFAKVKSIMGGK